MIELDKKYQTRDGRAVRILCVDNVGDLSVVGVFVDGEVNRWHADGTFCAEYPLTGHRDLIPVPTKHEGWMVVSSGIPVSAVFSSFKDADRCADDLHSHCWTKESRVVPVTWES